MVYGASASVEMRSPATAFCKAITGTVNTKTPKKPLRVLWRPEEHGIPAFIQRQNHQGKARGGDILARYRPVAHDTQQHVIDRTDGDEGGKRDRHLRLPQPPEPLLRRLGDEGVAQDSRGDYGDDGIHERSAPHARSFAMIAPLLLTSER